MKAKVQLFKSDGERNGKYPVKLILTHKGKVRRKTIAQARGKDWNEDKQLPRGTHPDYDNLYDKIKTMEDIWDHETTFSQIESFDIAFEKLLSKKTETTDFYKWAQERIDFMRTPNKKGITREGNARAYETPVNELKSFRPYLTFEEITPSLIEQFKEHKRHEGAAPATIKNYISELRAIYNSAVRLIKIEDKKPFSGIFHDVRVKKRRAANSYFSREDIDRLKTIDRSLLTPIENRTLDLTLLQFYLGGQSLTDVYHLKWEYIHKDRVFFPTRVKLTDRGSGYDVKIFPEAWEIINRYKTKGEYVFPWSKNYDLYKSFRENFNKRYLLNIQKKLGIELEPKGGKITSKVIRHTFATLGKFAGVEEDLLRELMGHERNDIDTVYKDKYPEAERDAAQRLIIGLPRCKFPLKQSQ